MVAIVQVGLGVTSAYASSLLVRAVGRRVAAAVGQFRERELFAGGGERVSFQDQLQPVLGGVEKFPVE